MNLVTTYLLLSLPYHVLLQKLDLPTGWSTYCPYTNFCHHNASKEINLTSDEKLCCEECSCDPDCGLRRNCCQYSMDKFRIDEKYHTRCTPLTTDINIGRKTSTYRVVDTCPNMYSCYDLPATPWGSMYPVYSNDTQMIYLNKLCAACNNDTNIVKWQIEVNCPTADFMTSHITEGLQLALNGEHVEGIECIFTFFPPPNADIEFQSCNDETITSCLDETSDYGETKELCETINATYHQRGFEFANIYCFLCSLKKNPTQNVCIRNSANKDPEISYTFLLGAKLLVSLTKGNDDLEQKKHKQCKLMEITEKATGKCRKIRCPEFQIAMDGKCGYFTNELVAGPFLIYIRLEPYEGKQLPLMLKEHLRTYKGGFFKSKLKSWSRNLYYVAHNNETSIRYFVLELMYPTDTISPMTFLDNIQKTLKTRWSLRVDNVKYRLKASIHTRYRYTWIERASSLDYTLHGSIMSPEYILFSEERANHFERLTLVRDSKIKKREAILALTKIVFCKQVDLEPDEYIHQKNDYSLVFKVTGQIFEEAEFKITPGLAKSSSFSICITNFGKNFWADALSDHACSIGYPRGFFTFSTLFLFLKRAQYLSGYIL